MSEKSFFVPELLRILPVPASLWREIQMMPFAIERISNLSKLVGFRETLMAEIPLRNAATDPLKEDPLARLVRFSPFLPKLAPSGWSTFCVSQLSQ